MSGHITLHPTLGVNPRMTTCDICGEGASILLLGGRNWRETCAGCGAVVYGGINRSSPCPKCGSAESHSRESIPEHEHQVPVMDRCSRCVEALKQGVALMLADTEGGKPRRLGPVVVMKEEAFKRIFSGEPAEATLKKRICFVDREVWDKLGLDRAIESEEKG